MVTLDIIRKDMKKMLDVDESLNYVDVLADTLEEALADAAVQLDTRVALLEYEVLEKGSSGFLGMGSKPAKIQARVKFVEPTPKTIEETCEEFLSKVFAAMDLVVKINVNVTEEEVIVDLIGDDMGVLIGKRGQTLDSLQYLLRTRIY